MLRFGFVVLLIVFESISFSGIAQSFNPQFVGSLKDEHYLLTPYRIKISGNNAYVLSTYALEVFDITVPASPQIIGRLVNGVDGVLFGGYPVGIDIVGNYAYIVSLGNTLEIVDISNPKAPIHKGNLKDGDGGALLGSPYSIDVVGNYAYIACMNSNALEIVDISDPTAPVHKGSIVDGQGGAMLNQAFRVSVVGNYAYVLSWGNYPALSALEVIDVSNPGSPLHIASLNFTSYSPYGFASQTRPHDMVVSGNYAYVVNEYGHGLDIIDVSVPSAPVFKGGLSDGENGALLNFSLGLDVAGKYAFVTSNGPPSSDGLSNNGTLEIIDISDPNLPVHKGNISDGSGGAELSRPNGIAVSGSYAYVLNDRGNSMTVFDISDATKPFTKTVLWDKSSASPFLNPFFFVTGNYAYLSGADSSIYIADVTNPTNPVVIGNLKDGVGGAKLRYPGGMFVQGNFAYVGDWHSAALEIIDVSNPRAPVHKGSISDGDGGASLHAPNSIFVSGNYAYIADIGGYLEIVDVSNPASPVHMSKITDGSNSSNSLPFSVFVAGSYAYVTDLVLNSLEIYDVADPAHPNHIGHLTNGSGGAQLSFPYSVFVKGNYAYIASYLSNALEIVDVSNPAAPFHVGSLSNGSGGAAIYNPFSISVSGNYAFLAGSTGLEVVDITNPAMPTHYTTLVHNNGFSVAPVSAIGNFVYVFDDTNTSFEIVSLYALPKVVASSATDITPISFRANWSSVAGATDYRIDVSSDNFITFLPGYNNRPLGDVTSVVVHGLSSETSYQYRVHASNSTGVSSNSSIILVKTLPKNNQTITFSSLSTKTLGDIPFTLSASSSSGLNVAFSSSDSNIASITGNSVSLLHAGSVTITATQLGDSLTSPAASVLQTFCVNPKKPTITTSGLGTATQTLISSSSSGNQWYLNGAAISGAIDQSYLVTDAGTYYTNVTIGGCLSENSDDLVMVITGIKKDPEILIYPTIVKNDLYIKCSEEENTPVQAMVFDMTGKLIWSQVINETTNRLDMSFASAGLYIIRLQGKKLTTAKFIKE